jgi:hypothetical protein
MPLVSAVCENCGQVFQVQEYRLKHGRGKNCSWECSYISRAKKATGPAPDPARKEDRICITCKKVFQVYRTDPKRFCSRKCANSNPDVRAKVTAKQRGQRRVLTETQRQYYQSDSMRKGASERAKKQWKDPAIRARTMAGIASRSQSEEWKSAAHFQRGEANPNYTGGRRDRSAAMGRQEYKDWRKAVFTRDYYTCQKCNQYAHYLIAHHIKPWAEYPGLRYDISNGVTLCEQCHDLEHGKIRKPKIYHCLVCGKPKKDGRRPRCLECGRKHLPLP